MPFHIILLLLIGVFGVFFFSFYAIKVWGAVKEEKRLKVAEEALRQSEAHYRLLFESSNDAVFVHPVDERGMPGCFLQANQVACSRLGYSTEEMAQMSPLEIEAPEDSERLSSAARKLMREGSVVYETVQLTKDGRRIPVENSVRLFVSQGRKLALSISRDFTERKQAEEAIRLSEERFRAFIGATTFEGIVLHEDVIIQDVNSQFAKMYGYKTEELIGMGALDLIAPEHREFVSKRISEGYEEPYETMALRKDGSSFLVEIRGKSIDYRGKKYRSAAIRDLTEYKRAENEKIGLEKQLYQAKKMESIGNLAGGIAHEFNNVLGIIIGNTELALMDIPHWSPVKGCLEEIRNASLRAKDVVRQILSYAQKTLYERKPIRVSSIIKESLKLMRASIPAFIEIRPAISCESEMILADPTEIKQVLMSLCTNAVHAMSQEGGVLEVGLESISLDMETSSHYEGLNPGRFVKLVVKDTGHGINPRIIDRIFDPYFTTKAVGEGSGMGLAVVYGIVTKHEGAIRVTSELGKGTHVEVLFPIIQGEVTSEDKEVGALPKGTERILLVDDEESLADTVKQMLEYLGYDVAMTTSSHEALDLFRSDPNRFDLVITDMAMPRMTGDRLAKELISTRSDLSVILCTGHSELIDEDRAITMGIKAYVLKPVIMEELAKTVRKVIDESRARKLKEVSRIQIR